MLKATVGVYFDASKLQKEQFSERRAGPYVECILAASPSGKKAAGRIAIGPAPSRNGLSLRFGAPQHTGLAVHSRGWQKTPELGGETPIRQAITG